MQRSRRGDQRPCGPKSRKGERTVSVLAAEYDVAPAEQGSDVHYKHILRLKRILRLLPIH